MREKLEFILENGEQPRNERERSIQTTFTDRELNAYLKIYGPTVLPDGLEVLQIDLGDGGHVAVRGHVDLDVVRMSRQRDWLDPMNYMGGVLEFTATGVVVSSHGECVAVVESATLAGVSVPNNIVRELVRYFSVTPEWPDGIDLDEPFKLPADIESIVVEPGRATIVQ